MKLVHLVGFIIQKFVTMQGHMNVKYVYVFLYTTHVTYVFMLICVYFKGYLTYNASHDMLSSCPYPISSRDDSFTDPRLD